MLDISYVNNTGIIRQNPKMTAINSAIEVDLTGQVCADSIGTRMYSGFGGQVDFIRGAAEGFDNKGKKHKKMYITNGYSNIYLIYRKTHYRITIYNQKRRE